MAGHEPLIWAAVVTYTALHLYIVSCTSRCFTVRYKKIPKLSLFIITFAVTVIGTAAT
jgi:hypothetical protein